MDPHEPEDGPAAQDEDEAHSQAENQVREEGDAIGLADAPLVPGADILGD